MSDEVEVEALTQTLDRVNGRTLPEKAQAVLAALAPVRAREVEAARREALTALGLVEEDDVDWCEFEGWWDPYRDGSGYWAKCNQPADHQDDHTGVDGGSWPRDLQDPEDQPKPRRYRLVTPWRDEPYRDLAATRAEKEKP